LLDQPGGLAASLNDFNLLSCFDALRRDEPWVVGYWGMDHEGGRKLAQRLVRDPKFRESVASVFELAADELPALIRATIGPALTQPGKRVWVPGDWGFNSGALDDLPEAT